MDYLINPTVAFMFIFAAVMLMISTAVAPKSILLKVGMVVCLVAAGLEISQLKASVWALIFVAISPFPFFVAVRQPRSYSFLAIVTILMLTIGAFLMFWDEEGNLIRIPFDGLIAIICARVIWILFLRARDSHSRRLSERPDNIIGLVGTAHTSIEKFEVGQVEIEGEFWNARSDEPIPAGSMVRIVRSDGLYITVEKVERLKK